MDIFKQHVKEIDFGEHGCPGVKVRIRQMAKESVRTLRQLQVEATTEEMQTEREEKLMEIMNAHVVGISGLEANGQVIDTMAKLMDVADSPDVVLGTLEPLITGITTELFAVSSMSAADLGNSQPLSGSGQSGSDGIAPSA